MPNKDIYDFGVRIKELRLLQNFSQSELAQKLDLHRNTVSGYEANTLTPSVEVLKNMAVVLNTSTDYLLGLDNRVAVYLDEFSDKQKTVLTDFIEKLSEVI